MGISLGLVGLGSFGSVFAPLFKNHPLVSRIGICDREPSIIERFAKDPFYSDKLNERDCYNSLDEICKADFDALVIITQQWLHAPQCLQALKSGKNVYSAVPIISIPDDDETLEWIDKLVNTVKKTGKNYMLGETTYYRPQAMFCRQKAKEGEFGDFVYAEGEYMHDVDDPCNLRIVTHMRSQGAAGEEGKKITDSYLNRGILGGPMHYPTHSTCGPICVMNAHAVKVNAHGFKHRSGDPYYDTMAFSNEMALFTMSNGATVRILEMRETPGRIGNENETFRIFGTTGSFSENQWFRIRRPEIPIKSLDNLPVPTCESLTDEMMFEPLPQEVQMAFKKAAYRDMNEEQLLGMDFTPQGHGGSHPYLVHEFVSAVAENRQPAINIWEAARYMAMGVAAHQSAMKDGETVNVPDWGDAPK